MADYKTVIAIETDTSGVKPVVPKVVQPKPVTIEVQTDDAEARRKLLELSQQPSVHHVKPVMDKLGNENLSIKFRADDAELRKTLHDIVGRDDVKIVGIRAEWQQAQQLFKELEAPITKKVEVVEHRGESAAPREHADETVEVVEHRGESAAPREHADETVEVVEHRGESAAPRKHPDEVVNVKVQETGSNTVIGKLKSVTAAALGVRNAIGKAFAVLGTVGFIINGVSLLIDTFRKIHEWANKAANETKRLADAAASARYASTVERAANAYRDLNEQLAKTLKLEENRNRVADARKQVSRDLEDANAEAAKQREIAKLDPTDKKFSERKADIERRYASEAIDRRADRQKEDVRSDTSRLYAQAAAKEKEAAAYQAQMDGSAGQAADAARKRWLDAERAAAKKPDNEALQAKLKELEKAFEDASNFYKSLRNKRDAASADAQSLRNLAAENPGSLAANIRRDADKQRLENERKVAEAEKKAKAAEAEKSSDDRQRRFDEERASRAQDRDFDRYVSQADDQAKPGLYKVREESERITMNRAQAELDAEMKKPASERNEIRLDELRRIINEAETNMYSARYAGEDADSALRDTKVGKSEDFASAVASATAPQGNRLTALGLGSGDKSASGDRQRILNGIQKLIEATKANKPVAADTTATFTS